MRHAYPLIAVVGPTGAGKSALALRLASNFAGEIVNCDSVQVHRRMDIGSAKTPAFERQGIPHHLLDVVEPEQELTAGDYARLARPVLAEIQRRKKLPVVVGGTGFYLRALLSGLSPAPKRNPELRTRLAGLAQRRPGALHRFLRHSDPEAAARIHPNDHPKLMRAIELVGQARLPREALAGFRVLMIGLDPDRAALYETLNQRSASMFRNGLLEETKALLDHGVPLTAKALGTLGYRQAVAVLTLGMPLDEAVADCQLRTRQYAKRQLTWFRSEPVRWLRGFGDEDKVQEEAAALVCAFSSPGFRIT